MGYSVTWPRDLGGIRPWEDGKAELVKMQEYIPGGMISAAPGPSNWFHQHFAFSQQPLRFFQVNGVRPGGEASKTDIKEEKDEERIQPTLTDVTQGGTAIPYYMEDPYIRKYFEQKLKEAGAQFTMPEVVYTEAGAHIEVMED
jgi:hypothetical protein